MPYMSNERKIFAPKLLFAQFLDKTTFTLDELSKLGHRDLFADKE